MVDNFRLLADLMNAAATLNVDGTPEQKEASSQALTDAFQAALQAWNKDQQELRELRAKAVDNW